MITAHFQDDDLQYAFEVALGATYRQAADVGEVLATAGRIEDGNADSWVQEWTSTAGSVWAAARHADGVDRRVSALAGYRRAATYYATALHRICHSSEPDRRLAIWRRQRACWERIVTLTPTPGQRIPIPYEDTHLPGYFFPASSTDGEVRRPLIVLNNGSDGATSHMWVQGGAAAHERGYHWMTFDGPGQQAALLEQKLLSRPDWERVLTPVLDVALARPDVDPDRIAVIGISQAGYWVTRALCFEHRLAAAVLDPGVLNVSQAWIDPLPDPIRAHLLSHQRSAFDREMHLAELFSPSAAATLQFRGEPYGLSSGSRYTLYQTISRYRLGDELNQITTPLLLCEPDNEQFWPGQSQQLHDRLQGPRELLRFTTHDGAGNHCEPLAQGQRDTRIFDWLAKQFAHSHDDSRVPRKRRAATSANPRSGVSTGAVGQTRDANE
jgi:hypothetical protein